MRKEKGITLVALSVTIVILAILAGITINYGNESIKRAKLETVQTNMLLIKAKTKECVEQANFRAGTEGKYNDETGKLKGEVKSELKGEPVETSTYSQIGVEVDNTQGKYLYQLTDSDLKSMGIKDVDTQGGERYLVLYNIKDANVEIYNTQGIEINGQRKYSLTDIQK